MGQPDVEVRAIGKGEPKGNLAVEVHGFDYGVPVGGLGDQAHGRVVLPLLSLVVVLLDVGRRQARGVQAHRGPRGPDAARPACARWNTVTA
jgi:hypothetical protein